MNLTAADFISRLSPLHSNDATEHLKKEVKTLHLDKAVLVITSKLDLDTDGLVAAGIKMDPTHQNQTALMWPKGSPVNSNETRFVVAPGGGWMNRHGLKIGDVGLACINGCDAVVSIIIADTGPPDKVGEASLEVHREFGREDLVNGRVRDVGIDQQFTMLLFTNTSTGHCVNNAVHEALALTRFSDLLNHG